MPRSVITVRSTPPVLRRRTARTPRSLPSTSSTGSTCASWRISPTLRRISAREYVLPHRTAMDPFLFSLRFYMIARTDKVNHLVHHHALDGLRAARQHAGRQAQQLGVSNALL